MNRLCINKVLENMMLARPHMFPQLHHCYDGKYRCSFFTANGVMHNVLCRYDHKRSVWKFRFRNTTWYFHADPPKKGGD